MSLTPGTWGFVKILLTCGSTNWNSSTCSHCLRYLWVRLFGRLCFFPQGQQQQQQPLVQAAAAGWVSVLLGAMVTWGEWEQQAVNNWQGVCYTDGLLALSKLSWVLTQIQSHFRIRKWSNNVLWCSDGIWILFIYCHDTAHGQVSVSDYPSVDSCRWLVRLLK